MKKRIDWFLIVLGIAYLIMGVVFTIRESDWFIIIVNIILGIIFLYDACYPGKKFFRNWLKF